MEDVIIEWHALMRLIVDLVLWGLMVMEDIVNPFVVTATATAHLRIVSHVRMIVPSHIVKHAEIYFVLTLKVALPVQKIAEHVMLLKSAPARKMADVPMVDVNVIPLGLVPNVL